MKDILIKEYSNTKNLKLQYKEASNVFNVNFVDGAFIEILGTQDAQYKVTFKDTKKNKIIHTATINNNMWARANLKYCIDWNIEVKNTANGEVVYEHQFNPKGKRVYIHLDSSSIGDTLAWFPYIEEFRKKWGCDVITSTFHNDWFESNYPELKFVSPGAEVADIYAMLSIGWFYNGKEINEERIPIDFRKHPLQQTASEILNVKYKETKPIVSVPSIGTDIVGKYVVIAPHASSHAKYWMYPGGWQTVIDYLNNKGYKVVMLTQEPLEDEWHDSKLGGTLINVVDKTGNSPLVERMIDIRDAELFIGVGSGLSWVSWALDTPTILISGFSYPYTEFQDCERIYPKDNSICRGCFNREWLDPGDWEWCPDQKDTPRQFECTKSIPPSQVLTSIQNLLHF
tara:strand:- start:695 stop:1891 length:1197 start_codon:yes stop_codon:yes gene_type:complete